MSFDMTSCPLALPDFTHAVQKSSASRQLSAHELDERYWGRPCKIIADTYDLTTREGEVFEQLARGYDIASMATRFVLSRSTLKMHIRHIYLKLDVHSKQDVINMVEQVRVRLCESDGKDTNTVL